MIKFTITQESVRRYLPKREDDTHKGDYGRILIIGGSVGYTGAPRLAANAALRCGSGLIYVAVPDAVYPIVAGGLIEPMVFPFASDGKMFCFAALDALLERAERCDACLIGIGMGRSEDTQKLTIELLRHLSIPTVLDADGINSLQGHIDVLRETACPVILTPHDGEFRRLGGSLSADRLNETKRLADETGKVLLRKGHRTLVYDDERYYLNQTGNPGMAVGGSGDVLSGIIVSLLGQGLPAFDAACFGAWLHGAAGDLCAREIGEYGMTPTDMIEAVPRLLK